VTNIIVIGASAGGIGPLRSIVGGLPANLQAALFVVMHLSPAVPSVLSNILRFPGGIDVQAAEPGYVRLTRGPRENRHRPAIDPLFRTAARAYGLQANGTGNGEQNVSETQ